VNPRSVGIRGHPPFVHSVIARSRPRGYEGVPLCSHPAGIALALASFHEYKAPIRSQRFRAVERPPAILGRKWELDRILGILDRRTPALIVVSGPSGKGKSRLLRTVQACAVRQGWKTVPPQPGDALGIAEQTTRKSFLENLDARLPAQAQESFDAGGAEERLPALSSPNPASQRAAHRAEPDADALRLARLRQLEPLLIVIDGYEPDAQLERWLFDSFVSEIEQGGEAIVVIIGTEREAVDDPRVELISIGGLDRGEVLKHFEAVGSEIDPPMSAVELDRYVDAACETPSILDSLERVLNLARRPS
jgi:AAA ATPase domain